MPVFNEPGKDALNVNFVHVSINGRVLARSPELAALESAKVRVEQDHFCCESAFGRYDMPNQRTPADFYRPKPHELNIAGGLLLSVEKIPGSFPLNAFSRAEMLEKGRLLAEHGGGLQYHVFRCRPGRRIIFFVRCLESQIPEGIRQA